MLGMWLDTTLQPPRLPDTLNTARHTLRYVFPVSEIYPTSTSAENLEEGGVGANEARAFKAPEGTVPPGLPTSRAHR